MKVIQLQCLLMPNSEILFKGRSLGFLKEEEKKYVYQEREFLTDSLTLKKCTLKCYEDHYDEMIDDTKKDRDEIFEYEKEMFACKSQIAILELLLEKYIENEKG